MKAKFEMLCFLTSVLHFLIFYDHATGACASHSTVLPAAKIDVAWGEGYENLRGTALGTCIYGSLP